MIGVILAAGVGSRLRPMTNGKPKCMVTVAGKPILQYQLDAYQKAGVRDIFIVVGYEGSSIREYCKHLKGFNITIVENSIYEDTNNMYSLYLVREYLSGHSFVLNNADLAVSADIVSMMISDSRSNLIAVDVGSFNEESMKVSIGSRGIVNGISKQIKKEDAYGCSIDFYKFSSEASGVLFKCICHIIEENKNLKDWTEVAMQRLCEARELSFMPMGIGDASWVEIDDYEDLALADRIFSQRQRRVIDYRHYCFDLDGTLYVGDKAISKSADVIALLKGMGCTISYLSNNSSKNKLQYVEKLLSMGIECEENEIILSTDSVIQYLTKMEVEKLFVLGTKSLEQTVVGSGFELCEDAPEFVLVGYDTELTYSKLAKACSLINRGVDFIATHCDFVCPSESGPIPDVGLIVSLLEKTTGRSVYRVFGKPKSEMLAIAIEGSDVEISDVLVVGDRLYTDIRMAVDFGVDSLLVLSGDTSREEVEQHVVKPTYILSSVSDML